MKDRAAEREAGQASYVYPLRLPAERLAKIHSSAQVAFDNGDYLYTARYATDDLELRACALLMLGNRVGGGRILEEHKIKTGRSCLYRAAAAWMDGEADEAQRWITEGLACDDARNELERFSSLAERDQFRVAIYKDSRVKGTAPDFGDLLGFEFIHADYISPESETEETRGQLEKIAAASLDLVIMDFEAPLHYVTDSASREIADTEAPVVAVFSDHEWRYDSYVKILQNVDLIALGTSAEYTEVAKAFSKPCIMCANFSLWEFPSAEELARCFADAKSRKIDFLFTGGISHDFYRDKRARILPLAHELDQKFKVRLYEGLFPIGTYMDMLRKSRFTTVSTRFSGYWSGRNIQALAMGLINLVSEVSFMPYIFSEWFDCFQVCRADHYAEDVAAHLDRYDEIVAGFLPHAPQLEIELRSMFPSHEIHYTRYLRRFIFVAHMKRIRHRAVKRRESLVTAGEWLRRALIRAVDAFVDSSELLSMVGNGLNQYPDSIALLYARAILLRSQGSFTEARGVLGRIAAGEGVLEKDDVFPFPWDILHGSFWIMNARIRECCSELAPMVPEATVWQSFAFSHLADMALNEKNWSQALLLAQKAVRLFVHNDTSQRIYLRALYALYSSGDVGKGREFLRHFYIVKGMDGRIFNDFMAMVYDVLVKTGRTDEAEASADKLKLFLSRVFIGRTKYFLYPEVLPLLMKYNLPHGALTKI